MDTNRKRYGTQEQVKLEIPKTYDAATFSQEELDGFYIESISYVDNSSVIKNLKHPGKDYDVLILPSGRQLFFRKETYYQWLKRLIKKRLIKLLCYSDMIYTKGCRMVVAMVDRLIQIPNYLHSLVKISKKPKDNSKNSSKE